MEAARSARTLTPTDVRTGLLAIGGAVLGVLAMYLAWHVAPIEKTLKMSQKILYFHVPLGIWTIVLSVVAAVAAAVYLLGKRSPRADMLCAACIEVGTMTCAVVLVTGSLWARPAWDDWFPLGEPRLTLMLVLFLINVAYLVLRSSVEDPGRRARFASVLAIVGAFDAVLAYAAIHLWNTQHPKVITSQGMAMPEAMALAFYAGVLATGLMVWALVEARQRVETLRWAVESLEDRLDVEQET